MREALLYEKTADSGVHCFLCRHGCRIKPGGFGFCRVRENRGGVLYTHNYGQVIASHVDPVEKKPLYHFLPGSLSFSIACGGCNFRCGFCQNWQISQVEAASAQVGRDTPAEEIVRLAQEEGCKSISYTYSEPTIFLEYVLEVSRLAAEKGIRNIFVTNGYMSRQAIKAIVPCLQAANVDLKFFKDSSYRKFCAASLEPVLESIRHMKELGIWIELTTLVIPGVNDSVEELSAIAGFIAGLDKDIPWHISRFHPDYEFGAYPPTNRKTLESAYEIGRKAGLNYVYLGNLGGHLSLTVCRACGKTIIQREGLWLKSCSVEDGKCAFCKAPVAGVFV